MIKFCAEIGSNHNRNSDRTIKLIQEVKEIGCDSIKFQLFKAEQLYSYEFEKRINEMKKWELPESFLPKIESYCNNLNIKLGVSVFDLGAVNIAKEFADWLKIGSYELLWMDLIKAVAKTERPWRISAGMESWNSNDYIRNIKAVETATRRIGNPPKIIFYTNSNYPASYQNSNLRRINELKNYFTLPVGWSDHTVEPGVIYKAIALGAEYIEFHFDLEDGKGFESPIGHCWKPSQIAEVIHNVRVGEVAEESTDANESEAAKWRTDPTDGFRPLREFREGLLENE